MVLPEKDQGDMSDGTLAQLNSPDEALIESSRTGDRQAFAELWRRHYRSGLTVARQFTSIDADDLVSEAFARIYKRTVDGGGPTGAFRPYLYTTIRNLACTWGSQSRDVQVEEIDILGEVESAEEPVARALDSQLTVRAYGTLPTRWQTVLWYTEVEGLDPHEVAPLMGLTANGVAALAYRAREGLRKAWLQAHVNDATASGACQWAVSRLGDYSRHTLTDREQLRMTDHLASCAKCSIMSEEVNDVGARLAMVLLPVLLGGVAGGSLLASLGTAAAGAGAGVATAAAIPALPASIGVSAAASTTVTATAATGSATGMVAIAASTVIVAAAGVGAVGVANNDTSKAESSDSSSSAEGSLDDPLGLDDDDAEKSTSNGTPIGPTGDPTTIPADLTGGTTPTGTTTPPTGTTTPPTGTTTPPAGTTTPPETVTDAVTDTVTGTTGRVTDTVDKVTDTVDKVGDELDKVGGGLDKVVDTVIPPKEGESGSQLGTVVGGVTDTLGGVTDTVDGLVGGLLGGGKKK